MELSSDSALVEYDATLVAVEEIVEALAGAGYEPQTVTLSPFPADAADGQPATEP